MPTTTMEMFSQWTNLLLQTTAPPQPTVKRIMSRNVVVKARVDDPERIESLIFHYTDSLGSVADQQDVYFNVPHGRMKLRFMRPNPDGKLIFYQRPNDKGPRVSESRVTEVSDSKCLRTTLKLALGELGVVSKKRRVYVKDNLRIHLDQVEGIGTFVEFSVSLDDNAAEDDGVAKANEVMTALEIQESQLIPVAYLDLLMQKSAANNNASGAEQNRSATILP